MWFTRKAGASPFSWLMEAVRVPRRSRASPLAPSSFGRDPISMNKAKAASEEDIQEDDAGPLCRPPAAHWRRARTR